jgi:hypothetical protein
MVALIATIFLTNPRYPRPALSAREWHFLPLWWLDIWGRWDTEWYLSIAKSGYAVHGSYTIIPNNIAFFPLYPMLVSGILRLLPATLRSPTTTLFVAVLVANLSLLIGLSWIRQLVAQSYDPTSARRVVIYTLVFPTGFFFSCAYPESLFLATTVGACIYATRGRWWAAGILGALAALSRPYGIAIGLPLTWIYLSSCHWKITYLRRDVLFLLLIPAALLGFLMSVRHLTGDLFAPFAAQSAWNRTITTPWATLLHPRYFAGAISHVEQVLVLGGLGFMLWSMKKLPTPVYGLYGLLITAPSLLSGTLMGIGRHIAVVFPIYLTLAVMSRNEEVHRGVQAVLFAVQVLFMAAWARFYPIV